MSDLPKPKEQGFVQAADGTSIYYEVHGEGKPLIFCYGLTCRREHWRYQLEHYSKTHQVILFDYRGHHASTIPANEKNLTIEWCARDLISVVEHLGLKDFVIFGHSMGVVVALDAMRILGRRVVAGVFICGATTNPFRHMFYTNRMEYVYKFYARLHSMAPDTAAFVWKQFTSLSKFSVFLTSRLGFNPALARDEDVLGYLHGVNVTPWQVFFSLISDYTNYNSARALREVKCPVLVLAGQRDFLTPFQVMEEMTRNLEQGDFQPIPYGSHNAHTDFPQAVNRKIDQFLERIEYS